MLGKRKRKSKVVGISVAVCVSYTLTSARKVDCVGDDGYIGRCYQSLRLFLLSSVTIVS